MKKIISILFLVVGILGLAVFGYQAYEDSQSFEILGADIAVSTANWWPVILSGALFLIGLILQKGK
ncbi:MAG: hypothetical protein LAT68_00140 [Cyclobacteriaceae bacterium]|nr:hypothetical protein [Cyclobacteriaceae bacterium]MCH8514710.1 hypothetical protein [Cyclobacteriaceae bacterium]